MMHKVIEMDQRSGEERAVARFEGEDSEIQAEAKAAELRRQARSEGREYLRFWVSD